MRLSKHNTLYILVMAVCAIITPGANAQQRVSLTLRDAIEIAGDSSLTAFRNQNLYASGYWEWRTFKADRLPSLSLNLTPAQYYRYITQRYDSQENIDVFRSQQNYNASVGLTATQNVDFLGGYLYLESNLDYLRNFGDYKGNQFSTIPVRLGYRQDLIGYNRFKWEKRLEPLKYEKVKREYLYNQEMVSETVVSYFFDLVLAQTEYRLARENVASADTLYVLGERRFKIAAISQADLLTLKLDKVNATNSLENAEISIKKAQFALASYLGMPSDTEIEVTVPDQPALLDIPTDLAIAHARENNPTILSKRQSVIEAEMNVNRTRVESKFNISLNASVGFNQVATTFGQAYSHPTRQDLVAISMTVPILDWGVGRGKYNMAKNTLNVAKIDARQEELSVEQEVTVTLRDFDTQRHLVASAVEALGLADMAYDQTLKRFMIGKSDINSLTLSHNRQQEASKNYISALRNYWQSYYKIRRLTLYDFEQKLPISVAFDKMLGVK